MPAALYFMGMKNEALGIGQPQHDPRFMVDDAILAENVAVMAGCAVRYLELKAG